MTGRRPTLRLMRNGYIRAASIPPLLVEAQVRANAACEQAWRIARPASDFAAVAPLLTEVVRLVRAQAAHLAEALGMAPYDALMDGFQPGVTSDAWRRPCSPGTPPGSPTPCRASRRRRPGTPPRCR